MKIALDYDKTYDKAPEMWDRVISIFKECGHEVVLLTYRDYDFDWTDLMSHLEDDLDVPVYCTGGVAKGWWSEHFGPGKIDVWIDDNPKSIIQNSTISPEQLKAWRDGGLVLETSDDNRSSY